MSDDTPSKRPARKKVEMQRFDPIVASKPKHAVKEGTGTPLGDIDNSERFILRSFHLQLIFPVSCFLCEQDSKRSRSSPGPPHDSVQL